VAIGALAVGAITAGLMTLAPDILWLNALSFLFGSMATLSNIAINVEADRVEAATGRRIINACHGTWSLSLFVVSLIGAGLRGAGIGQGAHLWGQAVVVLIGLGLVLGPMVPQPAREGAALARNARFAWPSLATLGIVAFGAGGDLLQGAAHSWSIIFLRDTFTTTKFVEGLSLPVFILAMTASRFAADRLLDAFPARHVGRVHLGLASLGVLVLAIAPNPALALVGFAFVGAGIGVVYPMMISAAARLGDRPATENVAAMTLIIQVMALGAPLFVGTIAEALSLRLAFLAFLPLLILGIMTARWIEPRA